MAAVDAKTIQEAQTMQQLQQQSRQMTEKLDKLFQTLCLYVDRDELLELENLLAVQEPEFLKKLMAYAPYDNWYGTILHYAARWQHPKKCGCQFGERCGFVRPKNVRSFRVEIVEVLLSYGADKTVKNYYELTPYQDAKEENDGRLFSNQYDERLPKLLELLKP